MDNISKIFEQLIHESTGTRRKYDKKDWVKKRQPRRARFLAKVLWYDKGSTGPFYSYDFEQRNTGQGLLETWKVEGVPTKFMHNEHLGLIKLLRWLDQDKKRWYCATIYMCVDRPKQTGKFTDERSEYSHTIYKVVHSRNEAKRVKWFNESLQFDSNGMVERGRMKAYKPTVAKERGVRV